MTEQFVLYEMSASASVIYFDSTVSRRITAVIANCELRKIVK